MKFSLTILRPGDKPQLYLLTAAELEHNSLKHAKPNRSDWAFFSSSRPVRTTASPNDRDGTHTKRADYFRRVSDEALARNSPLPPSIVCRATDEGSARLRIVWHPVNLDSIRSGRISSSIPCRLPEQSRFLKSC